MIKNEKAAWKQRYTNQALVDMARGVQTGATIGAAIDNDNNNTIHCTSSAVGSTTNTSCH